MAPNLTNYALVPATAPAYLDLVIRTVTTAARQGVTLTAFTSSLATRAALLVEQKDTVAYLKGVTSVGQ